MTEILGTRPARSRRPRLRGSSLRDVSGGSWRAGRVLARKLRGCEGALPGALVIGAQRGGTTSLYRWLLAHPQVQRPVAKEPQFFSLEWGRGVDWYRRHFTAGDDRLAFEASPYYLYHPLAPERVAWVVPTARCIALLRDPITRALSHHEHIRRLGVEPLEFALALHCEPRRLQGEVDRLRSDPSYPGREHRLYGYLDRGRYDQQLARWHCAPNPLLVIHSAELFRDPQRTFQRVLEFLELDPWHPPSYDNGPGTARPTTAGSSPRSAGASSTSSNRP